MIWHLFEVIGLALGCFGAILTYRAFKPPDKPLAKISMGDREVVTEKKDRRFSRKGIFLIIVGFGIHGLAIFIPEVLIPLCSKAPQ